MTITYDPKHPQYLDEADVRDELTRTFDVCHECRLCFDFCTSFPSLFEMIDRHDDQDAGRLTPAEQDRVVDECFQCKLCHVNCPYVPELHERAIDFPRLMLRADAMRHAQHQTPVRSRLADKVIGHTDVLGKLASPTSRLANRVIGAKQGGLVRKTMATLTGVSSERLLPPFARQRFTTWFRKRPRVRISNRQGRVAVYPTCLVEYHDPAVGKALVRVYERNGIECTLTSSTRCCGAPYLHSGDLPAFTKLARSNVRDLAVDVRAGDDIVVSQPTCGYVLKKDYVDHVGGADAELVAAHTFDAAEYLMNIARGDDTQLDTEFHGDVPGTIAYHTPCHLKAQSIGLMSRDLMRLTGARIKLVQQCSGIDGMWGLRAENADISIPIAAKLGAAVRQADGDVVVGDCHLANTAIAEQTGAAPLHPLQVIARAYGIDADG